MGMTIDESIDWLDKSILKMRKRELCTIDKFALNTALATMRKYQKIKEIMDDLNGNFYGSYLKDRQALEKIYKEVEDGKID